VESPSGGILPDSPVPLFPLLFLCEEPVLFEYNGVREITAPVRQTLHHCDREDRQQTAQMLTAK